MTPLESQIQELRERFGAVDVEALPSGASLITLAEVLVAPGWTKSSTAIRFIAPVGYPFAALDCFWADSDLRLVGELMPQNSAVNEIPETRTNGLWFSWHLVAPWNPNRDTLSSWINTVSDRFRRLQ